MIRLLASLFLLCATISSASGLCAGFAIYNVTFTNFLTFENFGDLPGFPTEGLVCSPLAGVTHSNRQSFLTVRGFASRAVEDIAEIGNNNRFIRRANRLAPRGTVNTVVDAGVVTKPGSSLSIVVLRNCGTTFLTVLGMIAHSPDWIVQISNMNLFDGESGDFVSNLSGALIACDTGVDDGSEFTSDADRSLVIPTVPQKNIAPLAEDDTDRLDGRVVGRYDIKRVTMDG